MVQDAAQAARAVAACRYAPEGIRSFGPLRADVALGSARPQDLSALPVCLVMIETAEALGNAEAIAATPGLDGIYLGPSDLALSLGLLPTLELEHPPVLEAIEHVRAVGERHGIAVGAALPHRRRRRTAHRPRLRHGHRGRRPAAPAHGPGRRRWPPRAG